jgi:hypothetical protein
MSDLKIAVPGTTFQAEQTITQVPIALGAGGLFVAANNLATITFNAAHGLTLTPAAGTPPNYFITFNGVTAQTGVGTLNGPIFRILSIPSATTIVIYTTVLTATMTAANAVPVFIPTFQPVQNSVFDGGPLMTGAIAQGLLGASGNVSMNLGPNCTVQYNPDNTSLIEDSTTGNTLAVAPTFRIVLSASTGGQLWFDGAGGTAIFASGGAGTSRFSVIA